MIRAPPKTVDEDDCRRLCRAGGSLPPRQSTSWKIAKPAMHVNPPLAEAVQNYRVGGQNDLELPVSNLSLVASPDISERSPRKSLLKAVTITYAGVERRALVRNVSDSGAMIETDLHLVVGEPMGIDISGHDRREAVVRWISGNRAGIEFVLAVSLGNDTNPRFAALNTAAQHK